jgi:hypothetical protein
MFNIDISGLDKLQHDLREAQRALESLNGTITTLKFNRADPQNVKAAIQQMEAAIDRKILRYRGNPFVSNVAEEMKAKYRKQILNCHTSERG